LVVSGMSTIWRGFIEPVSGSKHFLEFSKRVQYNCEFVAKASIGSIAVYLLQRQMTKCVINSRTRSNIYLHEVKDSKLKIKLLCAIMRLCSCAPHGASGAIFAQPSWKSSHASCLPIAPMTNQALARLPSISLPAQ
jgi:hypothetical protein